MSIAEQRFQTFITRVRPHRVAVLTNIDDPNWQDSCMGIIEFLTKLWGGTHCVIIPTDGKTISEEFWAVLSSHDPDVFLKYQTTYADLRRRDPAEFERILADEVAKNAAKFGSTTEEIRRQVEEGIAKSPFDAFTISDDLKRQILIRLAPFHFEKHLDLNPNRQLGIKNITRGSDPSYPLTQVIDVLGATARPKQVRHIVRDAPEDAAPPELWLAAAMGSADPKYLFELNAKEVVPLPVLTSHCNESTMIHWGIRAWAFTEGPTPFALSRVALTSVRSTAARRFDLPTVVVAGDSIREFCLYRALLWQQGRALWLPQWFMPVPAQHPTRLTTAILSAIENGRSEHNEGLVLVTYTVAPAVMQELKTAVGSCSWGCSVSVENITTALVEEQLRHPSRVFAEGNIGEITTQMLVNDRLPGWFESPVPSALNPVSPQSHRWLVDITFMEHLIPRHPALGKVAVSGSNVGDARSGIDGVSYMCPGVMVMGNDIETNTLRPAIRVPDAESIFRITLDDCGYECKISDKGRYDAESVQKFGGLEGIAYALRVDKYRALLKKFLDQSGPQKGVCDEGDFLKDKRRYLNFAAISKLLGGEDLARKTIDEYVAKGILYRGYIFGCNRCSDVGWFSIADIDQTFTCRRCGTNQQYTHKSWRIPDEPSWFYKLDEMIYLMLSFNGDVPLLTLDNLRQQSGDSFQYCPDLRITPAGSTKMYLEVDVCCITNGLLCIGEAKSVDTLATKDLTAQLSAERYRDLALKLGATRVVFSTSQPQWNQTTHNAIRTTFEPFPHIHVLELTASNLY